MATTKAVHECLFCPQTFDTATDKDDHILQHFAQETCTECNQNLIRIGSNLYTLHDTITCIKRKLKSEEQFGTEFCEPFTNQNTSRRDVSEDLNGCEEQSTHPFECFEPVDGLNQFRGQAAPPVAHQTIENVTVYETAEELQIKIEPCDEYDMPICDDDVQSVLNGDCRPTRSSHDDSELIESGVDNKIPCDICGRKLGSKTSLRKHKILLHSSSDTIFCNLCGKLFSTVEDRDVHRTECASKERLRKSKKSSGQVCCELCKKSFKSDAIHRQHMRRKHDSSIIKFKCDFCHATFMMESSLQDHQCKRKLGEIGKRDPIPCDICGKRLGDKTSLRKHKILLHSAPDAIFCNVCGRLFSTVEDRDVHRTECASKERLRKSKKSSGQVCCELCKKSFKSDAIHRQHMRRKHDSSIVKFKCDFCHATFMMESSLQDHQCKRKLGEIRESDPIPCDICGKKLGNKSSLRKHKILLHSAPDAIFCNVCGKLFENIEERDTHKPSCALKDRLRKTKKSGQLWCVLCSTEFQTDEGLRKHMRMKHDPSIEKFKCNLCNAVFLKESSLQTHNCRYKSPESGAQCVFPCDFCGKELSNRNSLRTHKVLFHSPVGTIFCNVCGKLFTVVDERDSHRLECMLKNRIQKLKTYGEFECDICKEKVITKSNLRRHMRRKHDPSVDKFKCKICNFIFMRKSSLRSHRCKGKLSNTTKEEPIPCDICGKVLSCKSSLRKHQIKFHSPPGTIFCRACTKIFPNAEDLNVHRPQCILKRYVQHPCDVCGRILANNSSLRKHRISLHSSPGTIFCKICIKKFTTVEELKVHSQECALKGKLRKSKKPQ